MNCCLPGLVKLRSLVLQAEHNDVSFPKKEHRAETSLRRWNNGVHKKLPMLALDKGGDGGGGWGAVWRGGGYYVSLNSCSRRRKLIAQARRSRA